MYEYPIHNPILQILPDIIEIDVYYSIMMSDRYINTSNINII